MPQPLYTGGDMTFRFQGAASRSARCCDIPELHIDQQTVKVRLSDPENRRSEIFAPVAHRSRCKSALSTPASLPIVKSQRWPRIDRQGGCRSCQCRSSQRSGWSSNAGETIAGDGEWINNARAAQGDADNPLPRQRLAQQGRTIKRF